MKRKLLSLVLAFALAVSLFTTCAGAVGEEEHALQRWSECGVLLEEAQNSGENMTHEMLAGLLVRLLKLPESSGSTDVERCIAAGLFDREEDAELSQSRAMVILGRALGLEADSTSDPEDETGGMLTAMIQAGIVSEDTVSAAGGVSLASVAVLLDRAIGNYVQEDGATVSDEGTGGITLIVAKNVTVTGKVDTLVVASSESSVRLDGATVAKVSVTGESSSVVLNNAEVKTVVASGTKTAVETLGTTKIETIAVTGASAAVKTADDTSVGTITVSAESAAVETSGNTVVEAVAVTGAKSGIKTAGNTTVGKLEVSAESAAVETTGKTRVETIAVTGAGASVKAADDTTVGKLEVSAENAAVETRGSTQIESVTVDEKAAGTTVTTGSGTTISKVENRAEGTTVTGSGEVKTVESSRDVAVGTQGTTVESSGDARITVTDSEGQKSKIDAGTSGTTAVRHVHSYVSDTTTAATCTEEGLMTFTCECGSSYTRTIDAAGHRTEAVEAVPASCTEAGRTAGERCSVCGVTLAGLETVPAAGHSYTSEITTAATCAKEGVTTYTCASCGDTYTEPIPMVEHKIGAYTYTNISTHTRGCSECGYTESAEHSFAGEDGTLCLGCGSYFVKTDARLKEAVAAESTGETGKTIVLTGDVTDMQQGLFVAQNVAFDLNTHTLGTAAGVCVISITEGRVSIKNGTVSVAPIVNGNSRLRDSCDTISVSTASKKSVTLDLEKVTVIGCENQKSGVTSATVEGLAADGMCKYQTTAGAALNIYGGGRETTVNITDSTITGGYGSATNGTQAAYISGGSNFAVGGIGIKSYGDKTVVNVTNSTVTGGDSDLYNAGNAIEARGAEMNINGSTVTGGSSFNAESNYGIGGDAMYINGMFNNVSVTVTESTVTGGDGGLSWDGSGIEARGNAQVTVTDSAVRSGDGTNATKTSSETAICTRAGSSDTTAVSLKGDNTLASSNTGKGVINDINSPGTVEMKLDGELTIEKGTMKNNTFAGIGENASIKVEEGAAISPATITAPGKTLTQGEDGTYRFTENQ